MFSRSVTIVACSAFIAGCTNAPTNKVGAAYDADSSYCRDLAKVEYGMQRDSDGDAPSNRQLYERHCEPIGSWQARDPEGHESTIEFERSLFGKLWDKIVD